VALKRINKMTRGELEAELESYQSRAHLYAATEKVASIGYFEWDFNHNCIVSCSEIYADIFGMSVAEVIAAQNSWKNCLQFVHTDDRDRFDRLAREKNNANIREIKFRIVRPDGEVRHIRRMDIVAIDENSNDRRAFGLCQDLTSLVERERELEYHESLSDRAESITEIGHYIYDEQNERHLYVSPGYTRIHGVDKDEYLNTRHSIDDVLQDVHEDDRARLLEAYDEYEKLGQEITVEYRIRRSDGEIRWLREISAPQQYRRNKVFKTLGVVQDITEQVTREQELLDRETVANQAEKITEIGHFIFNEVDQCYLHVSPGLARIHGVSMGHLIDKNYTSENDLSEMIDEDRERVRQLYAQLSVDDMDWRVEYRINRADGEIRWIREIGRAHRIVDDVVELSIGVQQDITEQKLAASEIIQTRDRLEELVQLRTSELANTVEQLEGQIEERKKIESELEFLANHDALTGLPSLRLCKDRLDRSLADSRRSGQLSVVMFLDLDGFKAVNDTYGHEFGDAVLKVTADRIKAGIRETDTVARIGGDEFIIILSRVTDVSVLDRLATNLIQQIGEIIRIQQRDISVQTSIGIAIYPANGTTSEELIKEADKAMYQTKHAGKNGYSFVGSDDIAGGRATP
jgi:diguanylate cyclase (GGDEF)-like protein/PAS domain S-box-containing protein